VCFGFRVYYFKTFLHHAKINLNIAFITPTRHLLLILSLIKTIYSDFYLQFLNDCIYLLLIKLLLYHVIVSDISISDLRLNSGIRSNEIDLLKMIIPLFDNTLKLTGDIYYILELNSTYCIKLNFKKNVWAIKI